MTALRLVGGRQECAHAAVHVVRVIKSNGSVEFRRRCPTCGAQGFGVKHSDVNDPECCPIVSDSRLTVPPCQVCGVRGAELHHWAPRALFEDCEMWPTAWLCVVCHAKWHNVMRATK